MDETTWWTTTTARTWMLEHVRRTANGRQLRLFGCACLRHIWSLVPDTMRLAVEDVEQAVLGRPRRPLLATEQIVEGTTPPGLPAVRAVRCLVSLDVTPLVHTATHALAAVPRDAWREELAFQCD